MQPSLFNVRVSLDGRDDVFLMNTFTDAQLIVSKDVADLLDAAGTRRDYTGEERDALGALAEHGFLVEDGESDRRRLRQYFQDVRESREQLRLTVLTTLQCNFACDYCIQGDHGDYNRHAAKMSLETAARVAAWTEDRLEALGPESFVLTFFGGEPLLNLPVVYDLAARLHEACTRRGVRMLVNIITNGLLLTPEVVDRLAPFGLNGVKVTLDGDRDAHNRMRPLRGGQGTFDRIIANIRQVADKCRVSIGGNFDASTAGSYPALLDFLREQEFASRLARVAFKPVIGAKKTEPAPPGRKVIPLTPADKPLNGACMTSAGTGASACDTCHFADETMAFLREETYRRGFETADGVHMGPCEIHRRHAYTIGPDGSLYACPGFAAEASQSVGHIAGPAEAWRTRTAERFDALAAWRSCGDCAFIPVCAGGCSVAAQAEFGDAAAPNCHRTSFEAGVAGLARRAAQSL